MEHFVQNFKVVVAELPHSQIAHETNLIHPDVPITTAVVT
jgi:hypothetical protein